MSDADRDTILEVNDAVAHGDTKSIAKTLDPDVVWEHNIGVGSPEEGMYSGREAVLRLFERIIEPWDFMRPEPDEIRDLGDGAYLIKGSLQAKHSKSERIVVASYEQRLEIRDGLLVKGQMTTGDLTGS